MSLQPPADIAESPAGTTGAPPPAPDGWIAELELWFDIIAGKTRLARRRHLGPLVVQRPFHPEADGTCHVYLLHPPGGIAAGDALRISMHLAERARAVLTTPGAAKFYRTDGGRSEQRLAIDVADGAVCEYLPQETIVFDGAEATIDTRVDLAGSATFAGWEMVSLGRPAAGETFTRGRVTLRTQIWRDGRPIWFERLNIAGGSELLSEPLSLGGHPIVATMIYAGPLPEDTADSIRSALGDNLDACFSVSQLEDVIVCRYLGTSTFAAKALFARVWDCLRIRAQGKAASAPRIWAT